jgi:hypothetical protein
MMLEGKAIFEHDESIIRHFLCYKSAAWQREGVPFHLCLTSPAFEVLYTTFAMCLDWAKSREESDPLIVYQSAKSTPRDHIYHPTIVGPDFFHKTGAVL